MNGNALKFRRSVEKHRVVGLDTAPLIYFIEDVRPYADLLNPVFNRLEGHGLGAVTSTITLAEILTKPLVDKNFSLVDEIKFTIKTFSTLSMVAIDEKLAEAAALIRARHAIRLPDAGTRRQCSYPHCSRGHATPARMLGEGTTRRRTDNLSGRLSSAAAPRKDSQKRALRAQAWSV